MSTSIIDKTHLYGTHGHRLNQKGYLAYASKESPHVYKLSETLTARRLLIIATAIDFPYYISSNGKILSIFSKQDAFILKLIDDDINKWLDNYET